MSSIEKLQIGIIGAGTIGNIHMSILKRLPNVQVAAVANTSIPLAYKRAKEYGIPIVHQQAEALIQDDRLDAVIICIPNQWHAPYAVQALEAGKHVLLEKPMGINLEAAKEIVRAQQKTGKVLMVGHQMRWESIYLQVKEQVEKGALGTIYNAKTGWFRRKGIPGWGTWFTRKSEAGGGPLIDIGAHMLDLALYLMGNPKPVSVFGSTYAEFGPKKRGIGTWGTPNWNGYYDVEDLATALIKMENGSTLSLEVSWAVHMDTTNSPFVHLMGSEGGASIQGDRGKLLTEMFDHAVDVDLISPPDDEGPRVRLSRHFLECITEGKEPITSAFSGFTTNLVLDAIYKSSHTGHEIVLDWTI